jgi:hypothetical protein
MKMSEILDQGEREGDERKKRDTTYLSAPDP